MNNIINEKEIERDNIIIFNNQDINLEVNMKDETLLVSQAQISKLFGNYKSTISEHIKNIYKASELLESETMRKFGNSEFSDKPTYYYNLDIIFYIKIINK